MVHLSLIEWCSTDSPPQWETYLHAEELHKSKAFAPARQTTYRYGRAAAKQALALSLAPTEIWIDTAENGKPFLREPILSYEISISHTRGAAFAAAGLTQPIGVDIEPFSEKRGDIVWKKLTPMEQSLYPNTLLPRALFALMLWTAKESAFKCYPEGTYIFNPCYEIQTFQDVSEGLFSVLFTQLPLLKGWISWDLKWIKGVVLSATQPCPY